MAFLSTLFKSSSKPFLGEWYSDITDEETLAEMGDIKLTFDKAGKLTYEIKEKNKSQFIYLSYRVKDDTLITNQLSHPKQETTEFNFLNRETLILKFKGEASRFVRLR